MNNDRAPEPLEMPDEPGGSPFLDLPLRNREQARRDIERVRARHRHCENEAKWFS